MMKKEYQEPDMIILGLGFDEVIVTSPMTDGGLNDWDDEDNAIDRGNSLPSIP